MGTMGQKHEYIGTCVRLFIDSDKDLRIGNFVRGDIRYSDPNEMSIKYAIQFKGEQGLTTVSESELRQAISGRYPTVWKIDNLRVSNGRLVPAIGKIIPYSRVDGREYCRLLSSCYMHELIKDDRIKYILSVTGHGEFRNLRERGYKVINDSGDKYSLRSITLRKGNVVYILFDCDRVYLDWEFVFARCKAAGLAFSRFIDTSNLSSFDYMFHDVQVGHLNLSGLNATNAERMRGMFSGSQILKFTFGGYFDTSKVKNMIGMFSKLNLRVARWTSSIDVSELNVSSVQLMSNMFGSCNAKISGLQYWNTHNVTDMEGMFRGSYIVSGEKLKDWDVSNVRNFNGIFNGTGASRIDIFNWKIKLSKVESDWVDMYPGDNKEKLMHYITTGLQSTRIRLPDTSI